MARPEPGAPAGAGVRESPRVGVPGARQRGAGGGCRSLQFRSLPGALWPHNPAPFPISRCDGLGAPGATVPCAGLRSALLPCHQPAVPISRRQVPLEKSPVSSAPPSTPERPQEAARTPAPAPKMKDVGAPESLGPYSPRSLSRLAQGAHGRGRARGDVSPSAAGRARRGASPRHGRCGCQRGPPPRASPPSGRPPAAPGAGRARPPRTRRHKLCARALPPPRRALPAPAPPATPTDVIGGRKRAAAAALFRILPPVLGSARGRYLSPSDRAVPGGRRAGQAPGALDPTEPAEGWQVCSQGHQLRSAAVGATPSLPPSMPPPCVSLVSCRSAFQHGSWAPLVLSQASFVYSRAQGRAGKRTHTISCGFALACALGCLPGSTWQDWAAEMCTVLCRRLRVWRCALGA